MQIFQVPPFFGDFVGDSEKNQTFLSTYFEIQSALFILEYQIVVKEGRHIYKLHKMQNETKV